MSGGPGPGGTAAGGHTRRAVLTGGLGALGGAAIAYGLARTNDPGATASGDGPGSMVVPAHGPTQAGIARPGTPQPYGLVTVGDLLQGRSIGFLTEMGELIAGLTSDPPTDLSPDGPTGLTVTVGLGPAVVAGRTSDEVGAQDLPEFAKDRTIAEQCRGGDLLLSVFGHDPSVLEPVLERLTQAVPGFRPRWQQRCFRGPGEGTVVRNPLGFHDGIQVPKTDDELADNVFLSGTLAGATICVIRRLRLDSTRFRKLPVGRREEVIGRRLDGSPLSGGAPFSVVNTDLKSPDGQYLIPPRAHVRAAHPAFTGSHLMLRRGYAFDNGAADAGLLFMCFQRDLRTFVLTQRRLDTVDDLSDYVTPTASGTFLVLPGFDAEKSLGHGLL